MTRTVDDVLRDYAVILSGRTRYVGQEPRDDELLIVEIIRLRRIATMARASVQPAGLDSISIDQNALRTLMRMVRNKHDEQSSDA